MKLFLTGALTAAALAAPGAATAQDASPAADQYSVVPPPSTTSGSGGDPADPGDPRAGGLPFTGLDLAAMGLAAAALTGAGVAIRRVSRKSEPAA
jgi:hypothetical protein